MSLPVMAGLAACVFAATLVIHFEALRGAPDGWAICDLLSWLLATIATVDYAMLDTVYLRARGNELLVYDLFERSALVLSKCELGSSRTGVSGAAPMVLSISDGSVRRKIRSSPFPWFMHSACRRLEEGLISKDPTPVAARESWQKGGRGRSGSATRPFASAGQTAHAG